MSLTRQLKDAAQRAARPVIKNLGDVGPTMRGKTDDIAKKARQSSSGTNRLENTTPNLKKTKPKKQAVKEYEVGSYKDLLRKAVKGDKMQHDHIPSWAAIKRNMEIEKGRKLTKDEIRDLYNNATAVELTDAMHQAGRTYGGKNTAAQVALDAQDLAAAARRDLDALIENMKNAGVPQAKIDQTVKDIIARNGLLGR